MDDHDTSDGVIEIDDPRPGLTREEDDELRRLAYLARFGVLDDVTKERMVELRLRDRRKTIREPRWKDTEMVTREILRIIPPSQRPPAFSSQQASGASAGHGWDDERL
ncbi:MAG TPA: hypothetical protein VL984_08335 [Acidimicrobiales bacterium]|nr:hypothetical protein [Acidimicrobiales bacterium]